MKRTILAAIVLLIAEFVIVYTMLQIPESLPMQVRILDIVVLSIVLWMICYDLFRPIVNVNAKNPREVGSLGVRWIGQIIYAIIAIGFGIVAAVFGIVFIYQLLVQLVLLAFLLLVFYFAIYASEKVNKVAVKEEAALERKELMRMALAEIQDEVAIGSGYPEYFRLAINEMDEKIRYISPTDKAEALSYEKQFADIAGRVCAAMSNFSMNEENIKQDLQRMQRALENRKKVRN